MSFATLRAFWAKTLSYSFTKSPKSCMAKLQYSVTPARPMGWRRVVWHLRYSALSAGILTVSATTKNEKSALGHSLSSTDVANILKKVDELINRNEFEELCKFLRPYKDSGQVELVWRLSYAAYTWRKTATNLSKEEFAALTQESYEMAKLALELDDKCAPAHKWMAIALDAKSELDGFRERCRNLKKVKEHMLACSKLDPSDATISYMLGMWDYEIANLHWYQRSILQAVSGDSFQSTFEQALSFFKKAEEISPDFYSLNLLMLGKCHYMLGDEVTAAIYLQRTLSYPKHTYDDHKAHKEASELIKKLKVPINDSHTGVSK